MNAITAILSIIPAIISAIKAIEAAIPNAGAGKAKLDAVLGIIEAADASLSQYLPQIGVVVGVLVKLFNATGIFTKAV